MTELLRVAARLITETKRELQYTWSVRLARDHSQRGVRSRTHRVIWIAELDAVEKIVEFGAKLHGYLLLDPGLFEDRQIIVRNTGSADIRVSAALAAKRERRRH